MIRYLKIFFKEKQLPYVTWELVDDDGVTHHIDNEVVIEHLKVAPVAEQEKIADMIRKIDYANGSVNDYLKHLAGALING